MRYKLLSLSAGLLLAGVFINSCKQDPGSSMSILPMKASGGSTPNPVIVYTGSSLVHGQYYPSLNTMDSDGVNQKAIITSYPNMGADYSSPTWSPDNANISFVRAGLRRVRADGAGMQLLASQAPDGSTIASYQAWSPNANNNEIAYASYSGSGTSAVVSIYLIPSSGGTSTLLYRGDTGHTFFGGFSWNADGSRLYFADYNYATRTSRINVVNRSTGQISNTYLDGTGGSIWSVRPTRTGETKIAYHLGSDIHVLNLSTLADNVIATNVGYDFAWSKDNNKLYYSNNTGGEGYYNFSTGIGSSLPSGSGANDWKR